MKTKVALITGGYSGEAQISYKSAVTVGNNIDTTLFDYYTIDITKDGWFYSNENGPKNEVNKNDFSIVINGKKIVFDIALCCIHGTPGEDGKLQGYFDTIGLKYTSCNAATSAITFNKRYTVAVAAFGGIHVAKSVHLFSHTQVDIDSILSQIKLPSFVKPNNGGSSLGMSKVSKQQDMQPAIDKAFAVDNQVLIEEMIEGREFTVGVYKTNNQIKVLPITEIITENEFFDFEAKYLGKSQEITPAVLDIQLQNELQIAATKVYQILNCSGVVRIDFIINKNNNLPYMLEVNTVPGQSAASVIPQQVQAMGLSLQQFYSSIINEALQA
jgi:D-alanine-D-alanine ligase